MVNRKSIMERLTRYLGEAAAGLVVTVVIAESAMALIMLFDSSEHLLWAVSLPTAAAGSQPALLAVIWLGAACAGSALSTALGGRISTALPAGLLPAACMTLTAWYFRQPDGLIAVLVFGPLAGCLLGIMTGKAVRGLDKAEAQALSAHGAEI